MGTLYKSNVFQIDLQNQQLFTIQEKDQHMQLGEKKNCIGPIHLRFERSFSKRHFHDVEFTFCFRFGTLQSNTLFTSETGACRS